MMTNEMTSGARQTQAARRSRTKMKHDRWIEELREHGYRVTPGRAAPVAVRDEVRTTLVPNQSELLAALARHPNRPQGVNAADLIEEVRRETGREMPKGSAGTALRSLTDKGLMIRKGFKYYLP